MGLDCGNVSCCFDKIEETLVLCVFGKCSNDKIVVLLYSRFLKKSIPRCPFFEKYMFFGVNAVLNFNELAGGSDTFVETD